MAMSSRKRYSIALKKEIVRQAKELLAQGISLRKTAASFENLKLSAIQLSKWIKDEEKMMNDPTTGVAISASARAIHRGQESSIAGIASQLLEWIITNRDLGMPVSRNMVILKASSLDGTFRRKSPASKYAIICRFLAANNLVIRSKTHQAQKCRSVMEEAGQEWITSIVPHLQAPGRDQRFIINMDQTPIFFSMTPKTTLQARGSKTVSVRTSSDSTKRITVAVCVTASGSMLPPLLIFNAKPNGRVERALSNFPKGAHYAVQKNAWMDERVMLIWVDKILEPYVKTAPEGVRPILFLDSYRCHMMASVVHRVQDLGVEVHHIPGGCTGVCQPVDVGIGKPFKNRVTRCWENWMVENGGLEEEKTKTPSREELSAWVIESIQSIGAKIIRNSWRRHGFSYFPDEIDEFDNRAHDANDDNDTDSDNENDGGWLFSPNYVFGNNKTIVVSPKSANEENAVDSMFSEDEEDHDDDDEI
jgi:hypothetical protein